MGAQNAIVGNDYGTDLPMARLPEKELLEEKKRASFSKSSEFQKLKEHLEERITFYQNYLPDGRSVVEAPDPANWVIANAIIGELKAIINAYEAARKVVEDVQRERA